MEYPGEISDARQHECCLAPVISPGYEHQVNAMYPARKDECVWPGKQDEIYYLVGNIVCKIMPPVTTWNGLCDCFVIPK